MPIKRYFKGESKTRLYRIWGNMKSRCYNPKVRCFQYYGGKGIRVFSMWHDFLNFQAWAIGSGYKDGLTLDRIKNSKSYGPQNCRWVTQQQQVLNSEPRIARTKNPFKGVHRLKYGKRWRAYIKVKGKTVSLGCYPTALEAAKAYDAAARIHYGEFARPNFK